MSAPLQALMRYALSLHPEGDAALLKRFALAGDQSAFEELVARHGPLVLGICRRGLGDAHLAEEAFQATFLVLSQRARKLRMTATLDGWLFGVARRIVLAARRREARHERRLRHSARSTLEAIAMPQAAGEWDDLLRTLDEELAALPAKYRDPLIFCFLRGRTQDEAARELGWSLSTLRRRLERGRELLRVRMTARGATLGAGLIAGVLAPSAEAEVPEALRQATASLVQRESPIPSIIMQLAKEGMAMSVITKWTIGTAVAVTAACGVALTLSLAAAPQSPNKPAPADPPPKPTPEVKRDRFNDPLPPGAVARMGTVAFRHPIAAFSVLFVDDGKRVVSVGGGDVRIWEAGTGSIFRVFGDKSIDGGPKVNVASVSADRRVLSVSGMDYIDGQNALAPCYRRVDLPSGQETKAIRIIQHPKHQPRYIGHVLRPNIIAPAGNAMAGTDDNGDVYLWDEHGNPTSRLEKACTRTRYGEFPIVFAPDGKKLVTCGPNGEVIVWNVATGERVTAFDANADGRFTTQLTVSPDSKYVVAARLQPVEGAQLFGAVQPPPLRVLELANGKLVRELDWGDLGGSVKHQVIVRFTPDSTGVVAVDQVNDDHLLVRRWRLNDGAAKEWTITTPNLLLAAMDIDPTERRLVIGTHWGFIRQFDLASGKELTPSDVHLGIIESLAFTAEGTNLVSASRDGTARVWDVGTGKCRSSMSGLAESVAISPDAGSVLSLRVMGKTASSTELEVREASTGRVRHKLTGIIGLPRTNDGRVFWARREQSRIVGFDASSGETIKTLESIPGDPMAITPDGKTIIVHDTASGVSIHEIDSGKRVARWDPKETGLLHDQDSIMRTAASPDGHFIAIIVDRQPKYPSNARAVVLCDTLTGKTRWQSSVGYGIYRLAFHPNGTMIAVGARTTTLVDAATGKQLTEFDGRAGLVTALAFSHDGKRLASGGSDGNIIVWDVEKFGR